MHEIIMDILTCLIMAGGIAIFRVVWPAIKKQAAIAEADLRTSKHELAAMIIQEAVEAVEQTVQGIKAGGEKKEKAIEIIEKGLKDNGIKLSEAEIDRMIEAFVGEMNRTK